MNYTTQFKVAVVQAAPVAFDRERTLDKLASVGGGPPFIHFGRIPLYTPDDLLSWARSRSRARRSTSDPGEPLAAA